MIKHVVMWKVGGATEDEKQKNINTIKEALLSLEGKVPTLDSIQVGLNENDIPPAFDIVLISTHPDWDGLQAYQKHPEHVAVGGIIGPLTTDKSVVDFEY